MDATGLVALEEIVSRSKKVSSTLIISGVQPQPLLVMKKYGLYDQIGVDYIIADFKASLQKAEELVAGA
jgi:SulP family sulfate permease